MADSLASSASSADLARKRSRSSSPSADPAAKKANQAAAAPDKLETDDQAKLEESADTVKGEGQAAKDESAPMNVDSTGAPSAAPTSSTNPDLPANPGLPANPEADASASASADGAASGASAIQMRALIVTQDASIIIGKQGKNVNEIRDKSGAKITITEAVPGNPERIMVIQGQLDAVSKVSGGFRFGSAMRASSALEQDWKGGFHEVPKLPSEDDVAHTNSSPQAFGLIVRRINDEPFDVPSVPGSRAVTIRFIIPNSRMGSVIGKAGAKIKEIQEASGARLQASEALLPGSTERVLSVSGVADAIHIAVYYIGTVLQEHPVATNNASYRPGGGDYAPPRERSYGGGSGPAPSGGGYAGAPPPPRREAGGGMGMGPAVGPGAQTQQIFIPNELVGSIIGKAGAKINEVRQVSQCQIKINEPGEAAPGGSPLERLVTITGQPSGIQVAVRMLYQRLEQEKQKQLGV
ncbi:SPOSA6832_04657, partial [Sporobolomyces salmonicolor]